jgi:hypothetical protein
MKLTKTQLKEIIREEIQKLNEASPYPTSDIKKIMNKYTNGDPIKDFDRFYKELLKSGYRVVDAPESNYALNSIWFKWAIDNTAHPKSFHNQRGKDTPEETYGKGFLVKGGPDDSWVLRKW